MHNVEIKYLSSTAPQFYKQPTKGMTNIYLKLLPKVGKRVESISIFFSRRPVKDPLGPVEDL